MIWKKHVNFDLQFRAVVLTTVPPSQVQNQGHRILFTIYLLATNS